MKLNTKDQDQLGEQLLKYGYSVATRKGFKGASLDDAALAFVSGAWEAYLKLDPEKMNGGDGSGFVYRGGMNGLIDAVRTMTQSYVYKNQERKPEFLDKQEEYKQKTARAKTLAGDYAPADLGDDGDGATLWDMLSNPKAEAPDRQATDSEQLALALSVMDDREKRILTAQAEGLTLREIGKAEGISAEAVRKIADKARNKALAAA